MAFHAVTLTGIDPPGVLPGARLWLRGAGLPVGEASDATVSVGGAAARVLFAASDRMAIEVPALARPGAAPVRAPWSPGTTVFVEIGQPWVTGLHLVDSPAIDAHGRAYCAISGPRGQEVPVSVYRVGPDGGREPVVQGLVNATSLTMGADGTFYVSSRYEGAVYRVDPDGHRSSWATELGVPCGLALAPDGALFVGDRTGTIHRLSPNGERTETFATLPPSVAAYHLAMGPDAHLYVTGPTLATADAIYRIDSTGRPEVVDRAFGRPQGLAFDAHGVLHVVEALAGVSAIYRLPLDAARKPVVAGPGLVGVAFDPDGAIVAATADALHRFPLIP